MSISVLTAQACSNGNDPVHTAERVIATAKSCEITQSDLDTWYRARKVSPIPEDPREQIEQMVLVRVLSSSAREQGLDKDPLTAFNLANVENAVLRSALRRHVNMSVKVDDSDVDAALDEDPQAYHMPKRVRVLNLYKRYPHGGSAKERDAIMRRMEELRNQLIAGADMAQLALAESDSETRYRGGKMGTFRQGQLPPALDSIVMNLEDGQISEILETVDGLFVLKCTGVWEARVPEPEEARAKVAETLLRPLKRQALEDLEKGLLSNADLSIDFESAMAVDGAESDVVATFEGGSITRSEFEALAAKRHRGRRARTSTRTLVSSIVEAHVVSVAAARRARELGLADESVEAVIQVHQDSLLATEELARRLRSRLVEPTDEEIRAYFDSHRDQFRHPEEFDLKIVRMPFSEETQLETHERAAEALGLIDSGDIVFDEAIRLFSTPSTPSDGSLLRTFSGRQMAGFGPAFSAALRTLRPGQVSRLIRKDDEYWIVKFIASRPAREMGFSEANESARRHLGQQLVDEIDNEIVAEIITDQGIEMIETD